MAEPVAENAMKIDLRELNEGETAFAFEQEASELDLESDDHKFVGPIKTNVQIHKLSDSLSASGTSSYRILADCSRCNEGLEIPYEVEFAFLFQKGKPRGFEGDEDESLVWLDADTDELDLGREVRDYILLEIPVNPVCEAYESGICPNLAEVQEIEKQVSCAGAVDPRWDALRSTNSDN
jgi:uncharacterized protein